MIVKARDLATSIDRAAFVASGEGPFRGCEGSVGAGYRLHGCALERGLLLSLCHCYYPK